jgi:hypothetical protein
MPAKPHLYDMEKDPVLIEANERFCSTAWKLLLAADLKPIHRTSNYRAAYSLLHQLPASGYRYRSAGSERAAIERIEKAIAETQVRHGDRVIVFWLTGLPEEKYVALLAKLLGKRWARHVEFTNSAAAAVACLLRTPHHSTIREAPHHSPKSFVLDQVPGIDTLGDDLRDDSTGRLDAKKISELFGITLTSIAKMVGVRRQSLDENPSSEKAQPVLQLFERIARLRADPRLQSSESFKKWFQKSLPMFSGHSAAELFKSGKLDVVAQKVDQLLTGDFGG